MSDKITIHPVELKELAKLRDLALETFVDSFGPHNSPMNMDNYVEKSFSFKQLEKEFNQPDSRFFFARANDAVIGYLKLNSGKSQTDHSLGSALEIERIYVKSDYQNMKVGQFMIDYAISLAKRENFQRIWLGVWDQNERAIKFYTRNNFRICGSHPFFLGLDKQTDILMKLELN